MSGSRNESPTDTWVRGPSDPPIIDQFGNSWTINQAGNVQVDGQPQRLPAAQPVAEIVYLNRLIWAWAPSVRLWWSKGGFGQPWLPREGTPTAPFGTAGPDPRIDQILTAVASLSNQFTAAVSLLGGAIQNVQNDVDEVPREIIPDPRIDAIALTLAGFIADVGQALGALSGRIDALAVAITSGQGGVNTSLGLINGNIQQILTGQTAITASENRIITMLLDLFPAGQQPHITADLSNLMVVGTQPEPLSIGP